MDGLSRLRWYHPVTWLLVLIGLGAKVVRLWRRKWCVFGHNHVFKYEADMLAHYECSRCGHYHSEWVDWYPLR